MRWGCEGRAKGGAIASASRHSRIGVVPPKMRAMATVRISAFVGGLSGRTGNAVFVRTPFGTVLRERPRAAGNPSGAQNAVRARMRQANAAYRSLSSPQIAAWRAYALALTTAEVAPTGAPAKSGQQVFVAYATKVLQVDPNAAIPLDPPAAPFPGDGVRLTLVVAPGVVRLTADAPNHPGVATEILTQPLPSIGCRTYLQRYRSAGFHRFREGALSDELALPVGATALAMRFVETATGRQTPIVELGVVVT